MAEVINLISSSPAPPSNSNRKGLKTVALAETATDSDSDETTESDSDPDSDSDSDSSKDSFWDKVPRNLRWSLKPWEREEFYKRARGEIVNSSSEDDTESEQFLYPTSSSSSSDDDVTPEQLSYSVESRTSGRPKPDLSGAIELSSSAPEPAKKRKRSPEVLELSDGDLPDLKDIVPSLSQPSNATKGRSVLSERTANLLSALEQGGNQEIGGSKASSKFKRTGNLVRTKSTDQQNEPDDDILTTSPPKSRAPKPNKRSKFTEAEKEAKASDRAASKAAKDAEKELAKERKRLEKEQKAQEKQRAADLAEVNKARTDKKESTKEMIIDISSDLRGTSVGNQVEGFMQALEVELNYVGNEIDLLVQDDAQHDLRGGIIKWRRKVTREYDKELDQYKPVDRSRIEEEKHLLVHLTAVDFAAIAARRDNTVTHVPESTMKANLDAHIEAIGQKHKQCKPIFMIEGLNAFLRKNTNTKNREFIAAARAANPDSTTTEDTNESVSTQRHHKKRSKKPKPSSSTVDLTFFTKDLADSLLLHLQLGHPSLLIHHTTTPTQSAHWIKLFTEQLSLRPYRLNAQSHTDAHAGFCMEGGQVKTAEARTDVFVRMLQELPRVTPSMAWGVVDAGFGGVRELVRGFRDAERGPGGNRAEAKEMLKDVRKAVNRDGGVSERRLGPMVSRRLWRVFFGENPAVCDV